MCAFGCWNDVHGCLASFPSSLLQQTAHRNSLLLPSASAQYKTLVDSYCCQNPLLAASPRLQQPYIMLEMFLVCNNARLWHSTGLKRPKLINDLSKGHSCLVNPRDRHKYSMLVYFRCCSWEAKASLIDLSQSTLVVQFAIGGMK